MQADILLATVTRVEAKAVLTVFSQATKQAPKPIPIRDLICHDLGLIGESRVVMVQSQMGAAAPGASLQTVQKAIAAVSPQAVIMLGIAFGVNEDKQAIGDVLVTQRLALYDQQKITVAENGRTVIPRGGRPHVSTRLYNRFQTADLYWDDSRARVRFGLILSGEKLVDDLAFRQELLALEPEAIGGEMEGGGLYVACQDSKVDWILVKAICDWADGDKDNPDKKKHQSLAAHNAAAFVLHALQIAPPYLRIGPVARSARAFKGETERIDFEQAMKAEDLWRMNEVHRKRAIRKLTQGDVSEALLGVEEIRALGSLVPFEDGFRALATQLVRRRKWTLRFAIVEALSVVAKPIRESLSNT